jgi:hypothetical protein
VDQAELLNPVQQIPVLVDGTGSLLARCHAMSTGLSTDPAVLMVGSMTLTLLATQAASYSADIQHPADDLLVGAGAAGSYSAGDVADVAAIEVQADTLRQVMNIVFSQTCIGTRRTYLSTGVALLDASDERIIGASPNIRMSCNHLLSLHGGSPW